MAVYNLNMADNKLIESISDPDELVKRMPRLNGFYEGVQEMGDLIQEISVLGSITKKTGFVAGKNFQRIASLPQALAHTIWMVDPDFWTNKAKVYRFLEKHPEYDTRRVVR